jgi:hypothetical protein
MQENNNHLKLSIKLMKLEKEEVRKAEVQARELAHYIFTPKNELETVAIAIAMEGKSGWKGSLHSLDYYDRYLEHTCFIFATQPKAKNEDSWLLVTFDSSDSNKYWIALGERLLSEVYYSWAKVVQLPNPQFDLQRMAEVS